MRLAVSLLLNSVYIKQKGYNIFPVPSGNMVRNFCPFS
jgi:hypothetical protein